MNIAAAHIGATGEVLLQDDRNIWGLYAPGVTVIRITPPAGDIVWVNVCNEFKSRANEIRVSLRKRLINGLNFFYGNKHGAQRKFFTDLANYGMNDLALLAYSTAYCWWNEFSTDINVAFPYAIGMEQKKLTGEMVIAWLKKGGFRVADIRDLFIYAGYFVHGIPGDYLIYRAKCMEQYGQPWKPKTGVPYYNRKTNALVAGDGSVEASQLALKLLVSFPAVKQGQTPTFGRPWGEPYWATGGWVMENGYEGNIDTWIAKNPWPSFWGLAKPAVTPAIQQYKDLYYQWLNGNLPTTPLPSKAIKMNSGIGAAPALPDSGPVPVTNYIRLVIRNFIIGDISLWHEISPADVACVPEDFKMDYTSVAGNFVSFVGSAPVTVQPNGNVTQVDVTNPTNQPVYAPFTPKSSAAAILLAATALIFIL